MDKKKQVGFTPAAEDESVLDVEYTEPQQRQQPQQQRQPAEAAAVEAVTLEPREIGELMGGEKIASLSKLAYYLQTLCDAVQVNHNEWMDNIHGGVMGRVPVWAVHQKMRRANCNRYTTRAHAEAGTNGKGHFRTIQAHYCEQRTCPYCSQRMARANEKRLNAALDKANAAKMSRDGAAYKLISVTLTVPNCQGQELRAEVQNIGRALRSMTQHGKSRNRLAAIAYGYAYGVEITRNVKTGLFHPHVHLMMAVKASYGKGKEYVSRAELTQIWAAYVHRDIVKAAQYIGVAKNPHQAVKYLTKMNHENWDEAEDGKTEDAAADSNDERKTWTGEPEFDAETLYWLVTATRGLKLNGSGGVLKYKATDTPETKDDPEAEADGLHRYTVYETHREGEKDIIDHQGDQALERLINWLGPEYLTEAQCQLLTEDNHLTDAAVTVLQQAVSAKRSDQSRLAWQARKNAISAASVYTDAEREAYRQQKEAAARETLLNLIEQYAAADAWRTVERAIAALPQGDQREAIERASKAWEKAHADGETERNAES